MNKMKKYEKLLKIILIAIIVIVALLTLAGMVLGPLEMENISVKLSQSASVFAILGIAVAFAYWKSKD